MPHRWPGGRRRTTSALIVVGLLLIANATTLSRQPTPMATVPRYAFAPVIVPASDPPLVVRVEFDAPARTFGTRPDQPEAEAGVILPGDPEPEVSLSGKASWYCSAELPVCHFAWPPGSLVAAACGDLRRALPEWRGKTVLVSRIGAAPNPQGDTVGAMEVRLVDSCASEDKTIDVYWEVMRRLGGTGVLDVTVEW